MSKNSCLYISPFFAPESISSGKWNTVVCDALSEKYKLTVLCLNPFYPEWKMRPCENENLPYNVIRIAQSIRFPANHLFRRLVLEFSFAFLVIKYLLKNKEAYDQVILVLPPTVFALLVVKHINRSKNSIGIISIVHDLQSIHLSSKAGKLNKVISKGLDWIEKQVFDASSKVIFLSTEMKNHATREVNDDVSDKNLVAYPFVTLGDQKITNNLGSLFSARKLSIVYSGALGEKQCPNELMKIMRAVVNDSEKYECHIFSSGPHFEKLKKSNKSDGIKFHGLVEECEIVEQLMRSDVQIVPQAPGTSAGSLPSKLPNIIASGTKLFVITDMGSELERLLARIEGVSVQNEWDIGLCASKIRELASSSQIHNESRKGLIEKFSIGKLTSNL